MLGLQFDYASCVRSSEKVRWTVEEVMPKGTRLDLSRSFLPEPLSGTGKIACLAPDERIKLNQITANAYLNLFAFVEEYILAVAVQHAQAELFGDHDAIRALTRFAEEEVKHQQLFARYREAFDRDFGRRCGVLDSAAEVAGVILSKSPIAVMTMTLHIELMTQQHYTQCVRDDAAIDPFFARLLRYHWLEEAQHAKIDALELDKLLVDAEEAQVDGAIGEYLGICEAFDGLLRHQADMDLESLSGVVGRSFAGRDSDEIRSALHAGYRRTFLVYGMTNPTFAEDVGKMSTSGSAQIAARAASLS
jgi:hypothetical protein